MKKKIAAGVLAAATLGSVLLGASAPAFASSGGCVSGDACLYYSPNLQGAKFGKGEFGNYSGNFGGGGAGNGQPVLNNAASVWNMDHYHNLRVHYREFSIRDSGPNQFVPHDQSVNLGYVPWNGGSVNMRNNNHSQSWEALYPGHARPAETPAEPSSEPLPNRPPNRPLYCPPSRPRHRAGGCPRSLA